MKLKIILCVLLTIVLVGCGAFVYNTTGNKCDSDDKNAIRNIIEKALRIEYGWENKKDLKGISTEEFLKKLNEETFYRNFTLYKVDRDFMENFKKTSDGELSITVPVYTPDICFSALTTDKNRPVFRTDVSLPVFTLIRTKDGKYLISDVQYDIY